VQQKEGSDHARRLRQTLTGAAVASAIAAARKRLVLSSAKARVWSGLVVVGDVSREYPFEVAPAEHQDPVQALSSGGADEVLRVGVRLPIPRQHPCERGAVDSGQSWAGLRPAKDLQLVPKEGPSAGAEGRVSRVCWREVPGGRAMRRWPCLLSSLFAGSAGSSAAAVRKRSSNRCVRRHRLKPKPRTFSRSPR